MHKIILSGISIILMAPFILTLLFYFVHRLIYQQGKKAFHFAISYTSPVYLISVLLLNYYIFKTTYIIAILVFLISLFSLLLYIQWRVNKQIIMLIILKLFSRICFLIFFCYYFLLLLVGLMRNIFS